MIYNKKIIQFFHYLPLNKKNVFVCFCFVFVCFVVFIKKFRRTSLHSFTFGVRIPSFGGGIGRIGVGVGVLKFIVLLLVKLSVLIQVFFCLFFLVLVQRIVLIKFLFPIPAIALSLNLFRCIVRIPLTVS